MVGCVAIWVVCFGLAGCGSSTDSLCDRRDECRSLNGSLDECKEALSNQLDDFTSGRRADCERAIDQCLELQACNSFTTCDNNIRC